VTGSDTRRNVADSPTGVYIQVSRLDCACARDLIGPGAVAKKARSRRKIHPRRTFFGRVRGYFLAGILVTAPIGITLWFTWAIITFFDGTVVPLIPAHYNPETYLPIPLPGLGLVLAVIVLVLVGWLAAGLMGRWLVRMSEQLMARMPVVRNIYSAIKQIMETVLAQNANAFRHVVLLEYPRRGIWTMGFVTGTTDGEVQHVVDAELVNVFVPTTPNPTSGFLLFVPKKDLYYLDMTSEEGFKMLVSTGIVTPVDRRSPERQATPTILAGNEALAARADPPARVLDGGKISKWPGSRDDPPNEDTPEGGDDAPGPERSVNRS
jgi:uncharacterized membrane protein